MSKKAAIELSLGTLVIIVLSVTMLILGMVFIRNLMCSGISMTDIASQGVINQLNKLFGQDTIGVVCNGENGDIYKIGTGGIRAVFCLIKTDSQSDYDIKVKSVTSISGATTATVQKWIIGTPGWSGKVAPGGDGKTQSILRLNIPRDAPSGELQLDVEATNKATGTTDTHTVYVEIVSVGFLRTTMC